jgi:type III secretion system YscD/HrpQ family protein
LKDHGVEGIEETELTDRESEKTDQLKKPSGLKLTPRQKVIRYTLMFAIWFGIAAIVSAVIITLKTPKPISAIPLPIEQRVQQAIDELKLIHKIKVTKTGDESLSVVGYVGTMEDSLAIKSAIKQVSEDISLKLTVMEKVIASAQEMVRESKRNVILKQSEEFGEIIATGYIKKAEIWAHLKGEILSIKGITNIKDEVLTKTSAVELAKSVLEQYQFKEKLEAIATDEGIEVKGTISDVDKDRWGKAREDFEKTFKKKAQLKFEISVSTDRNLAIEKFFGGKVDSINFSNQGLDWINIKGGNKYFQGSVLPSGYVIDQIESESVTVRNADEVIQLKLEWM